jgi:hypothetical protein
VAALCRELYGQDPEIVLLSGGARGVDSTAEFSWHQLGGLVNSYRIKKLAPGKWVVEKWVYRKGERLLRAVLQAEPSFQDPTSALFYRSMLVAEAADRVCAFAGRGLMRGTEFTTWVARNGYQKPVHLWRDGAWT